MIIEEASGWLVHKRRVAEHALWLTLFTRDHGVVRARMQGSRLLKKNELVLPFTSLWWSMDVRSYGAYLRQIEPLAASLSLSGRYVLAGFYLNELIYHALPPNQPEPAVFTCYEQTLQALQNLPNPLALEALLRRFEWQLLLASGLLVSFAKTGDDSSPIQPEARYALVPAIGFVLANEGFCGAHLLAIAQDQLNCPQVLQSAKRIMRAAIDYLLPGIELHSRRLYRYSIASSLHVTSEGHPDASSI